jgi:zinc protease
MAPRGWWWVAILCLACGPRAPSRTIRFQSTVHSARLANGLRVLVIEDHDTNLVDLGVRLDVGSIDDPAGKAGLAHLVEHLMFQVKGQPDQRPLLAHLTAVAVGYNAYTSFETTHYRTVARADQLEALLRVEGERFAAACSSVGAEAFEREREVVRNELRLRGSEPMDAVYPPGHPYARPIG